MKTIKPKKISIAHYLNTNIKKGAQEETPIYPVYVGVVFLRYSARIKSLTDKYMTVDEFEALKETDKDLLKEVEFLKYYIENEWASIKNSAGSEKFIVGKALKDFNLRLLMNTWSDNILLFQGTPQKSGTPLPIIELDQNYNNKLSAESAFVVLVPDSELYAIGMHYEIRLKGKPIMTVWLESKATYSFDKITAFVARVDRGMELQAYKTALRYEWRAKVDTMAFALLSLVIIRNTQNRDSH